MESEYDAPPMPSDATRNLFLVASGFGIGALVVLGAAVFLVGIGEVGHTPLTGPTSPAQQSASSAPAAPGPAPKPAPSTAGPAVPTTTGQAPAPADSDTKRAQTEGQKRQ